MFSARALIRRSAIAALVAAGLPVLPARAQVALPPTSAPARPVAPPGPPTGEALSRSLLELKAARAAAARQFSPADPALKAMDQRIDALQQQILAHSGVAAPRNNAAAANASQANAAPMFPRIVTSMQDTLPARVPPPFTAPVANLLTAQADSPKDQIARAKLEQPLSSLRIDKMPLAKFVEGLEAATQCTIDVNWNALQAVGIDRNTEVTLHVDNATWHKALTTALNRAGGNNASLGYTVDDGSLVISTKEDLNSSRFQTVRLYDIRDFASFQALRQYPFGVAEQVRSDLVTSLTDTIKSAIAPDSWRDNGGTIGSIRELNGILIVNQSSENQLAIQQLLAQLHAMNW